MFQLMALKTFIFNSYKTDTRNSAIKWYRKNSSLALLEINSKKCFKINADNTILRDCSGTWTYSHFVCKWKFNHLAKLAKFYLFCDYLSVRCIWLFVLIMSRTHFRVDPYSIVAWISRNSLLKADTISEV